MKCLNCGARVKKSEELCPECGANITPTDILETAERYNYKDFLLLPSILRIGGGIALFLICIFTFDSKRYFIRKSLLISHVLSFFVSVYLIFRGVAGIIQEKKCELNITSDRIYGRIPVGIFDTEAIDINISDIISIRETGFATRYSSPEIHIITAEKETVIKGSSEKMLSCFSKSLYRKIKELKEKES